MAANKTGSLNDRDAVVERPGEFVRFGCTPGMFSNLAKGRMISTSNISDTVA
jgi:23S rRNA U2552 (ribose-2'-O)-methylase RlmE/FtsJ